MVDQGVSRRPRHPAQPWLRYVNAVTRWILHTPVLRRLADRQVIELRFTGTRTGRTMVLPVMYAQRGGKVVVLVGGPERKRWWRNFTQPHPAQILLRGVTRTGTGRVVARGDTGRREAVDIYAARFPNLRPGHDPFVVFTLDPPQPR